jgi:hypothetical protein
VYGGQVHQQTRWNWITDVKKIDEGTH